MKKTIALLLSLIMLLSVFAACGESTVPADEKEQESSSGTQTEEPTSSDVLPDTNEDEDDDEDKDKNITVASVTVEAPDVILKPSTPSLPAISIEPNTPVKPSQNPIDSKPSAQQPADVPSQSIPSSQPVK